MQLFHALFPPSPAQRPLPSARRALACPPCREEEEACGGGRGGAPPPPVAEAQRLADTVLAQGAIDVSNSGFLRCQLAEGPRLPLGRRDGGGQAAGGAAPADDSDRSEQQ